MRLTSAQKQLYNMEVFAGGSIGVICGTVIFDRILDIDETKRAINEVYKINESLRTRIKVENGEPIQYVTDFVPRDVKVLYFDTKEEVHEFADKTAHTPFDFSGNLCELDIFMSKDFSGVIYKLHHIISDGWTLALISSQLHKILEGQIVEAFPYSSYIDEETKYLESKRYTKDKEYFMEQYRKVDEITYLCDDAPNIGKSIRKSYIIDQDKTAEIMKYASEHDTSAYIVFLTLVNTYFSKTKNNIEKFFIGTNVLNRTTHSQKNTAGMFVNTVPFLAEVDNERDFSTNVKKNEETIFSLFRHQKYNYVDMLSEIGDNRLFDIIFDYQNNTIYGDHTLSTWYHNGMQNEHLQIHVDDRDSEGVFRIHYDYQIDKFTEEDIDILHQRLMTLLCDAIENPDKSLYELEYLTEEEKKKVLVDFNDTAYTYDIPENATIYSLFEEQAEKNKEKVCLKADNKEITFGDFKAYAERIDSRIRSITEEKSVIAVICERSFEMYGAVYGIIRGGNAYLPIDPNYPQERIDYILSNSNAKAVVTQDKFCHLAGNTPCIDATEVLNSKETKEKTEILATPEDTAYVIYTSGSTGNPKGAKISHKSAVNRILWMDEFYPLEENDVILQKTPYTFDVSVWELFWWGMKGRTLCASKPDEHFLPAKILDETNNHKVTHLHFVPSVFDIFLTYLENNPDEQSKFNTVKYLFLSGEALTANSIKRFYNIYDYNKVQLHNLYGPTECAVDVSYYDCKPTDIDPVPIGKPIYNTQLYVVDKYMNPTPIGVVGELCIGGVNVGQGYLNNEELTKEKFIDNPFYEGKIYKTGDLAYIRPDGEIIFCGRMDHQIKLNGQRIELGEIENAIGEIDGVVQCAVIVRKDNENRQYICAFYTGKELEAKEFRAILNTKLPKYMVPHVFTYMEEMPMTVSGKISRNNLPEVDLNNISTETEYVAPETAEEKALAAAIEEVLGTERVSMEDNFFNVGGDSISAIYIVSVLEEMGYELHVADIMQSDTLAVIAKLMESTDIREIYDQYEVNGYIPFTPIMKAFLNEEKEIPKDFVHICTIATDCDEITVKKAIKVLVSHHDMLRGRFVENGIEILSSEEGEAYSFKAVKTKEELEKSEDKEETLVNVTFCKEEGLIKINVHHFLIDLISWEVLIKDFNTIINQIKNGEKITLPAKTASFKLWNEKLTTYGETMPEKNRAYWEEVNNKLDNAKSFCSDEEVNEAEEYSYTFDKDISNKLVNEVNKAYGTRTNEVLLTALGLAAGKIAEGNVGIMVESHGRTELHKPIAAERTIGWFTSCYPVVVNNNENITEELINVKETMRRIPKNGVEYLLINEKFHKNTDILFNFYKTSTVEEGEEITFGGTSVFPGKINVNCFAIGGIVTVNISVPECKHRPQIGEKLGRAFVTEIENIIDICTGTEEVVKTRSDFSDDTLIQSELDELMDLFN